MTRTFPTLALIGVAALGTLAWQTHGRADTEPDANGQAIAGFILATDAAHVSPAADLAVADGPHADAIRELLAAAPGPDRDAAAQRLRERGPAGFAALREALAPVVADYNIAKRFGMEERADELEPVVRLLDTVAAQRDAYAAGLYWYTDMEDAKAQAQQTGKPILSLRMLGNLDEEYSCANSRFFRTVLYADAQLGDTLRDNFVLHWQSVRPVPVITIDMGDGRVIRRTITGNSCHLVLDPQGRPVDVIPGLYGPRTFEQQVQRGRGMIALIGEMSDGENRAEWISQFHEGSLWRLDNRWAELTPSRVVAGTLEIEEAVDVSLASSINALSQNIPVSDGTATLLAFSEGRETEAIVTHPTAQAAEMRTIAKGGLETVLVNAMMLNTRRAAIQAPEDASADVWQSVAAHYAEGAELDASSRRLMHHKAVPAQVAGRMAFGKSRVEDPLLAMVQNFESAIAMDTARNEHLLHRQIHQWFIDGEAPMDADELTSRVYAELFLTPDEDPWLGLVPADTYSALDAGGLEAGE